MKKVTLTFVFVFLTIGMSQTKVAAKDTWTKVKSKNFTLIGNASEKNIVEVATKLEQFSYVFGQLFPEMSAKSPIPTTVVVFKNENSFKDYKNIKWAAGYFQPGSDINYIALHTGGEKTSLYSTIFHEYIHFLVNNNIGKSRMPPWFNEGIAEYYDRFKIEKDQIVTLGDINSNHLLSLQRSKLIPLDQFFKIDSYSLHQQGSHGANIFYAQAWALIHYLIQGNDGARNSELTDFLNRIVNGEEPEKAFPLAFKSDYATMEKELEKYVRQNRYKTSLATFKEKLLFENDMKSFPMSESEANANLGDLLFNLRRYDEAEIKLKEALSVEPLDGMSNATMGMLKMRQEKYSEAESYLEKAVNAESVNYRIYYQYGYVLSHVSEDSGADADSSARWEKVRNALKKAITLNPSFPASYDLMAYLSLRTGENIDDGIEYLKKALQLSPGNQSYMLNLANLYLRKRDIEKALPIVESVYKTSDEGALRNYAAQLLQSLRDYQNQLAKAKDEGYEISPDSDPSIRLARRSSDDPEKQLTPEEEKAADRDFQNESINRMMRAPASADEKRFLGYLSKIECKDGLITYTINKDGEPVKLESKDFESLELMAFKREMTDLEVGCDSIKKDTIVVVTYRSAGGVRPGIIGKLIALEFVPEDFVLREN
ncbi:MAG: DUF1570 domain-containing protein [Pyrinomonadaceae bacterium]